ncbi:TonB-dependent receptor [Altererythrobacter salegens]|uniref:TonB-dependent receptor n=1 Tax=Croceibacterium salegens TaxID=1737568 RepID=A0A6I4SZN4_9SPHN|nr:TonB-dependent receptor [Croceibacterium salegens]MXO60296.1 TonB-dependent receptor [Croceibacterium salegens]
MKFRTTLFAGAAASALFFGHASAQAAAVAGADESDRQSIVVLGQKLEETTPEELEQYGSRLEIVEGKAIDQAGFDDTGQALQMLVPGLYVSPKNGAFDYVNVSLLGSRTSEVLFTVDGVRMGNRLYTGTTPLDTLPSSMIERIEVLKGGQGLYYGTQAVGGIVNVITKGFTRDFDGSVEAGYDTNDGYHANGYLRGGGGDHYFVAFASYDEAEGFQPFHTSDYQPSATDRKRGYRVATGGLKYAYEPADAFRLSASYQHTDAKVEFAKAEDVAAAFNTRNEEVASLKIDWTPSDRFGFYVKAYWHDWDSTYSEFENVLGADGLPTGSLITIDDHDPWVFEDRGINLLGEYKLADGVTVIGGYDYQKYDGMDAVFLIGSQSEEVHAPFAQVKLDLGGLKLAAGVRHNMPSDGQSKTVWNVSGRYAMDGGVYLRGMVGTSFRLPDAYELYVIDPCCEQGNPNLVAEESFNTEFGVGLERGMFSGEVLGFYRKTDNLIDIDYSLPAYPDGFIVNTQDSVTAWGGEAIINARLDDWFGLTFDYTHTEVEASGTNEQIQDIPRDLAKLILTAEEPGGRFGGTVSMNWVGKIYDSVGGGIGRVQHGDYAVVDLAGWFFVDSAHNHRLGVRLENLFDTDYATRITRVRRDADGSSYPADNRGTPFTVHVTYRLAI